MCVSSACCGTFFLKFLVRVPLSFESEKARSQKKKPHHAACETTTTEKKRVRSMREIIKITRAAFACGRYFWLSLKIFLQKYALALT